MQENCLASLGSKETAKQGQNAKELPRSVSKKTAPRGQIEC